MPNNADRASSVEAGLAIMADEFGYGINGEDAQTLAGDAICNILHWTAQETGDIGAALEAVKGGLANFAIELAGGPAADWADGHSDVNIKVAGHAWGNADGETTQENEDFRLETSTHGANVIEGFTVSRAALLVTKAA